MHGGLKAERDRCCIWVLPDQTKEPFVMLSIEVVVTALHNKVTWVVNQFFIVDA